MHGRAVPLPRLVEEELYRAVRAARDDLLGVRGRVAAAGGEESPLPQVVRGVGHRG